ncbi:hypothetical protein RND81_06G216800 [Saponaria officinalis]|uniref:Uncharacterized protein n=1 Tax=Saponaria officinalis TaxID=3572 RepID=A0AAW1KEB7_SAPOF
MGRSPSGDNISGLKKGPWTEEEDDLLTSYIQKHGGGSWTLLPKMAGLNRCGKSCRLRWTNYLRPDIKRGRFSEDEEDLIIKLHSILGNKWSRIAAHLPGRTDNEIKNYWNTYLRKKLLQMGIDPVTHKPRTDHLNILANISQFYTTTPQSLGTLMNNNPWDINNSLKLQPNFAQLAKLQVLQNILQILNTNNNNNNNSLPNIIDQIIPINYGIIPNNNVNYNNDLVNIINNTNNIIPKFDINNNYIKSSVSTSHETLDDYESRLPPLINLSHKTSLSNLNQIERNNNSTNGSSSYTPIDDDFFGGLEKALDDGNSDFWKEFIN